MKPEHVDQHEYCHKNAKLSFVCAKSVCTDHVLIFIALNWHLQVKVLKVIVVHNCLDCFFERRIVIWPSLRLKSNYGLFSSHLMSSEWYLVCSSTKLFYFPFFCLLIVIWPPFVFSNGYLLASMNFSCGWIRTRYFVYVGLTC